MWLYIKLNKKVTWNHHQFIPEYFALNEDGSFKIVNVRLFFWLYVNNHVLPALATFLNFTKNLMLTRSDQFSCTTCVSKRLYSTAHSLRLSVNRDVTCNNVRIQLTIKHSDRATHSGFVSYSYCLANKYFYLTKYNIINQPIYLLWSLACRTTFSLRWSITGFTLVPCKCYLSRFIFRMFQRHEP